MSVKTVSSGAVTESFVGCVVRVYSESVQVMSDIFEMHTYAVCYDADAREFKTVFVSSDYPGGEKKSAEVDATESVKECYEAHLAVKAAEKALAKAKAVFEDATRYAARLGAGKTVKVVRGRKVKVGTVAKVKWAGECRAYAGGTETRALLVLPSGEEVWTAGRNVEVVVGV